MVGYNINIKICTQDKVFLVLKLSIWFLLLSLHFSRNRNNVTISRLANDRRSGRLRNFEIIIDFKIMVGAVL